MSLALDAVPQEGCRLAALVLEQGMSLETSWLCTDMSSFRQSFAALLQPEGKL